MKVVGFKKIGEWSSVLGAARTTVGMKGEKEPSSEWKKKILLAEHSPIRMLSFNWKWEELKSWVSVHFVRHKYGIEHFVRTQRSDRTNIDRNEKSQDSLISHEVIANPQALIYISRKRLCNQASKETRQAWISTLTEIKKEEPEIVSVCVPECVYRGFCPEMKPCGYSESKIYQEDLKIYRKV